MTARRFKPYPTCKDSGVEWLGEIPAHWEIAPVYARYEVALGKMLDAKRVTGECSGRYLRNIDVQWDRVNTEGLPEMDFAPWEHDRYSVRPGDLLVCEGGEVGRTAIWHGELEQCFYQKALHRVRPRAEREVPRFFYYLMYTVAKRGVFAGAGNQNTIDHLTAIQLRHYRFPFASELEQRAIAAFLDRETARIDALVAKKERLIELLQEQRTALITRAVTKGLDPNVPMKDSGVEWLGQVARHWEVKRIKLIAQVGNGSTPNRENADYWGGDYPWLNSSVVNLAEVTEGSDFVTDLALRECHLPRIHPPAVLVGITGEGRTRGMATVLRIEATINQHLAFIRPTRAHSDTQYIRYGLHAAYQFLRDESGGGGSTKGALTCDQLGNVSIPHPPLAEQRAIAAFLDHETARIDALVAKVRDAIDRLKELRTAIISAAVTGKIDVREEAA